MEKLLAPTTATRGTGPPAGGPPDSCMLLTTQVTLQPLKEPPREAGSLCPPSSASVPRSFPPPSRGLTPRASLPAAVTRVLSVCCHHFYAGVSRRITPPVPHLWPCQYQQFESLH